MRTALVVPVPEAASLVDAWRARTVRARGIPPHVTLTFPFAPVDEALLADVRALAARFEPFDYVLARCARSAEFLYLDPQPAEPFVALTRAVLARWPAYPRYGGAYGDEIVPHVTAAQGAAALLDEAEAEIAPRLPVPARATELLLLEEAEPDSWLACERVPLG